MKKKKFFIEKQKSKKRFQLKFLISFSISIIKATKQLLTKLASVKCICSIIFLNAYSIYILTLQWYDLQTLR